jgi:TRAP-type C4-dicarboxylate transport system permease small subunit
MTYLIQLDKTVARLLKWTVIACFFGLFLLLAFGIVQRSFPAISVSGYDELIDLLFVWLTFAGTAALWREGSLYRVGAFDKIWSPALRRLVSIAIHVAMLFLLWILVYYGADFGFNSGETTPYLQANKIYWYVAIPLNALLMSVYSIVAILRILRNPDFVEHQEISTLG